MSEKRLIDFDEFQAHHPYGAYCPGIECCEENCKPWQELKRPTLTDACETRTLDSMTEEEFIEYRTSFMEKHRQNETKEDVIESITLHISWDEVPLLAVKWLLEKGFNVFGEVDK